MCIRDRSDKDTAQIRRELAYILTQMHSVKGPYFGYFTEEKEKQFATWKEAFYQMVGMVLELSLIHIFGTFAPQDAEGVCVYCNHCAPCPAGLNIGLINKYYDLSKAGDVLAKDHYRNLEIGADRCVQCGHCNKMCIRDRYMDRETKAGRLTL